MLEQHIPGRLHLMKGTYAGEGCEELQPMGKTYTGEVHRGPNPVGGATSWSQGSVKSHSLQEGPAETMCDKLTATSIPCSH